MRPAAKIYSVPHTTLIRGKHGRPARGNCQPKSHQPTDLKDKAIVEYVLDLDSQALPPRIQEMEDMANRLLKDRNATLLETDGLPTTTTALSTFFFWRYDYKIAQCEDPEIIRGWYATQFQNTVSLITTMRPAS